jgi:hypothetical protein
MPASSETCSLCQRREGELIEVGSAVPFVCISCARGVGRHILEHAGHAVVWDLEGHALGVPPKESAALGHLVAKEIRALVGDAPYALTEEPMERVSPSVFDGPIHKQSADELATRAWLHVDLDVRYALKNAAEALTAAEASTQTIAKALRLVFHPRILRRDGLDKLRRLLFKE